MPKIFVIIVTYNGSKWIQQCLNSLRQSTIALNVIIIDNKSSDGTPDRIKEFPEVKFFPLTENLGFGKANNIGIKHAVENGAEYVFLLNQDAWIRPDTIKKLIDASLKNPQYYILSPIHTEGTETKLDMNFSTWASPSYCKLLFSDLAVKHNNMADVYETSFVNAALWLLTKNCLKDIGCFDPIFTHYGEDDDYVNRVKYHGFKIGICPHAFGTHDRPQIKNNLCSLTKEKKLNRYKMNALVKFKNINNDLARITIKYWINTSKALLKSIVRLNFSDFMMHLHLLMYTSLSYSKIKQHRQISAKIGANKDWMDRKYGTN